MMVGVGNKLARSACGDKVKQQQEETKQKKTQQTLFNLKYTVEKKIASVVVAVYNRIRCV